MEEPLRPELKTLEWDILNPNRLINLEIKKKGDQALISISNIIKFSAQRSKFLCEYWTFQLDTHCGQF